MKSRKEVARLANEYVAAFEMTYQPKNKKMAQIIANRKKELEDRQIAPQIIMEKMVTAIYRLIVEQKCTIGDDAAQILKQMEILSRTKTLLPFKRYDPWIIE